MKIDMYYKRVRYMFKGKADEEKEERTINYHLTYIYKIVTEESLFIVVKLIIWLTYSLLRNDKNCIK